MDERLSAVLLATLILLAPIAGAAGSAAAATSSATSSSTVSQAERPDGQVGLPSSNVGPPDHANAGGTGEGGPPGLQKPKPNANIPTDAAAWDVHAGEHASDLIVEIGQTPSGDLALGFTDDTNHDGRRVSVNASTLVEQVGHKPQIAYGLHEDGSTWRSPISYEDGFATWRIPEFSSNTVEFSGEFVLQANATQDGDQHVYEAEGGENLRVNVTGSTNTAWDNASATNLANGDTLAVDVAGNAPPSGPSANGEPVVTFTGDGQFYNPSEDEGDGTSDSDVLFIGDTANDNKMKGSVQIVPQENGSLNEIVVNISQTSGSDYLSSVDLYINKSGADHTFGEGTKLGTWDPSWTTGKQTINLDGSYDVTKGQTYEIEFYVTSTDSDGTKDQLQLASDTSATSTWYYREHFGDSYATAVEDYADVELTIGSPVEDPAIDIDGDGTNEAAYNGVLESGQSVTKEIPSLSVGDDTSTVSTTQGNVSVDVKLQERTKTVDATVELNGSSDTHAGVLNDGETVSLSIPDSAIENGTNQINISVGDGTLSSDAPTPQFNLDYRHDVVENKSVDYNAEAFAERYNVSKTWVDDTNNAQLNITWASGKVIEVRNVEVEYRNSTGVLQSTDTSPAYSTKNGTLTVELGDVPAGWSTRVKASGGKVQVVNGSIKVLEATIEGDKLDTKIEITSKSSGFAIDVSGLQNRVHHLQNPSWTGTTYTTHDANGDQTIHMPDASQGSTTRIQTMPLTVKPSNEIEVVVEKPGEPRFRLRKGDSAGSDDVTLIWADTVSGETYKLVDETNGKEVMRDEAQSPVKFSTTGEALTYTIKLVSGGTAVAVDSSDEFGSGDQGSSNPVGMVVLLVGYAIAIGGVVFLGRRWFDVDSLRGTGSLLVTGLAIGDVAAYGLAGRSLIASFFAFLAGGLTTAGGGAFAAFVESGALPVVVGFTLLLGVFALEAATGFNLPRWLWIVGGGLVVIWVLDSLANGGLTSALEELGPLLWLLLIGGGIVLLWRALQPTIVQVGGSS